MGRPCKCRYCQTNIHAKEPYLVMIGKLKAYFCNDEHYKLFTYENEEKKRIKIKEAEEAKQRKIKAAEEEKQRKIKEAEEAKLKKQEEHDAAVKKWKAEKIPPLQPPLQKAQTARSSPWS